MMQNKHNDSRIRGAVLTAALVLAATSVFAGSVLDTSYGSAGNWLSAEINAMGGTGAAVDRGGFNTALNPANLSAASGWRIDGGLAMAQEHEDRFQPLWDSFGSFVVDTAIASNRNHYFDTGFAASKGFGDRFGGGVSLTSRYDFTYDFAEEVRDPDSFSDPRDQILQERSWGSDGSIRDLGLGVGYALSDKLSLGVAAHYLFGTVDGEVLMRDYQNDAASSAVHSSWEADGMSVTAGATLAATERLTLGAAFETPVEVGGDLMVTTGTAAGTEAVSQHVTVKYPKRVRAGMALRPRTDPRTLFTAELVWSEWSQIEDSRIDGDVEIENTYDYRVGVEHLFYNGVPVRFGFRHTDQYVDEEVAASMFTAGVGIPYVDGMININADMSKVTSNQEHFFAYPDGFAVEPTARVEETRFRLGASFTYAF
jgi:hypothetical protein